MSNACLQESAFGGARAVSSADAHPGRQTRYAGGMRPQTLP
jgi:hypothetical protein